MAAGWTPRPFPSAVTPSLRAERSNPESPRGDSRDCFAPLVMTVAANKKRGVAAAFFNSMDRWRSGLRLRLEAGIRVGPGPRLAGRGHGGGARRGRLQHGFAVRLFALEEIDDLVARQRLELQEALGQRFEVGALLGQNARRFVVAFFDKTPDLGVDLLDR